MRYALLLVIAIACDAGGRTDAGLPDAGAGAGVDAELEDAHVDAGADVDAELELEDAAPADAGAGVDAPWFECSPDGECPAVAPPGYGCDCNNVCRPNGTCP